MRIFLRTSCFAFFFATALSAQGFQTLLDKITFDVGGGLTETASTTKTNLDHGRNIIFGAGYNVTSHLAILMQGDYEALRLTQNALNSIGTPQGYPGGRVRMVSVSLEPQWHFHPKGSWDFYVIGGFGDYQRRDQLTRPTIATATGTNPYFGFNTPGYPSSEVGLNYTINKPGVNIGAGASIKMQWNFKLFLEVKYHHVMMGSLGHMDILPISAGVRW